MEEQNRVILETVRDMLAREDLAQAVTTVSGLHSADAAEVLANLDMADETAVLVGMEPRLAARALLEMEESHQVEVAAGMHAGQLSELLSSMPVDEAVDLLGDVPEEQRAVLLRLFGAEEAGELEQLLAYSDDSAGGLMTPDFVSVSPRDTVDEVIESLRAVDPEVETIYYVYAVAQDDTLEGVLSLRELIISPPGRRVEEMLSGELITVGSHDDQEKVADVISRYNLLAVPVVDERMHMLGIVTVDDVMDVIGDEAEEDLMRFAGATGREEEAPGLFADFTRRLPWFLVAVIVEILVAGGLLKLYSPVLQKFLVLIFFIPLLVTMGGNIAVQSSTIMAHSLVTGRSPQKGTIRAMTGEVLWGVLVGLLAGAAVGGLALLFHMGGSVGLTVGLSLALTVIAASMVGCAMPLTLRLFDRDPAAASGPFIGTTMDVLSLAIYLGIGRLLI